MTQLAPVRKKRWMSRLSANNLTCFRGGRLVFQGLSFAVETGGALLLTGTNGSGKSSLLRILAGLLEPFDGAIAADGVTLERAAMADHTARSAYIGHQDALKPTLTVAETLDFWAAMALGSSTFTDPLADLNLTELADVRVQYLSSGQRRRLALTRLLVSGADLWLMDEPTVGLDTASVALVEAIVAAHRAAGGSVVLSTHIEFRLEDASPLDLGDYTPATVPSEAAL